MKTVALVGFGPSHVDAPFADETIEIWAVNYHHEDLARTTRIFELHEWDTIRTEDGGIHLKPLAAQTAIVYMQETHPEVPMSVAYPLQQMSEAFALPHTPKPYFTSTVSYMVALAITEGFDEIQLFGIDLAQDTEYAIQRPSCEFFLGIAVGRGIRVVPHPKSDVLKTAFLYGYEDTPREWLRDKAKARRAHLQKMQQHYEAEVLKHRDAMHQFLGALQENDHLLKTL